MTKALAEVTSDGFCYRVDLNLRPHGRSGAIAMSLAQALSYYETLGRTWERAALLKARVVAGDKELGEELLSRLEPFVFRRSLDLSAVDALRDIKAQIDLRGQATPSDVKLGPGGIREVEFFANALQLLHGGKNPTVRERHTLRALRRLEQAGQLSATDVDGLEEAYLFLRRVENQLQEHAERQTQLIPDEPRARERLARSLRLGDWPALERELQRQRALVQRAFGMLLGQTAREEIPKEPLLALALDPDATAAERAKPWDSEALPPPSARSRPWSGWRWPPSRRSTRGEAACKGSSSSRRWRAPPIPTRPWDTWATSSPGFTRRRAI